MIQDKHPVALVTGGSRGIGAATALALAEHGYDVAITYRNKAARASEVEARVMQHGVRALSVACDITQQEDIERLFIQLKEWSLLPAPQVECLNLLVLNAAGGLERDLVAADPQYPMRINRDAQLALVDAALPLMTAGGVVLFVTSHLAHLHGKVNVLDKSALYLPSYAPVASTKHAGEQALRARQKELANHGIRLIVVTGDLIEGTIMAKLLERSAPGLTEERQKKVGHLPTVAEMGEAIAAAAADPTLPSGHTVVVGGTLDSFLESGR